MRETAGAGRGPAKEPDMFQKHMIIGRLGKDPDLRYTPNGQPVCNFPIAAERIYLDSKKKEVKEVTWYSVKVWGKLAEISSQNLFKGHLVLIDGRLNVDPKTGGPIVWFDESNNPHANFEIIASSVKFLTPTNTLGAAPAYIAVPESEYGEVNGR